MSIFEDFLKKISHSFCGKFNVVFRSLVLFVSGCVAICNVVHQLETSGNIALSKKDLDRIFKIILYTWNNNKQYDQDPVSISWSIFLQKIRDNLLFLGCLNQNLLLSFIGVTAFVFVAEEINFQFNRKIIIFIAIVNLC